MDNEDEMDLENDPTYQFLRNLSLPAESSSTEVPPKKRTKVDSQTWYPIDRISTAPEYFDLETGETTLSHQRQSSSTSLSLGSSYENSADSNCVSENNHVASAVWDVVDPHGFVRGLTVNPPEAPVFSTGIVPTDDEKSTSSDKVPRCKKYRDCTLYAPRDGDNVRLPVVDRPLGCKTVSISGLPHRMSSRVIEDVFGDCGRIRKLRRRREKRDVVQITFSSQGAVDEVLELNGYKIIGHDRDKKSCRGVIEVDFVPIWKEQQDYIRKMEEHQKKSNQTVSEGNSSLKPLQPEFSKETVDRLMKGLCDGSMVNQCTDVVHWIEKGECNKKNSIHFFNILSAIQSSVSRVMNETAKLEESFRQQQNILSAKYVSNSLYFGEILKIFNAASTEAICTNFPPGKKRQIKEWKKYIEDINESNTRDMNSMIVETNPTHPDNRSSQDSLIEQQLTELKKLHVENESLKRDLKVAQKEAEKRSNGQITPTSERTKSEKELTKNVNEIKIEKDVMNIKTESPGDNFLKVVEKEARLIAAIGAFLNFHRSGESIENIHKYLLKFDPSVTSPEIECLMKRLSSVFKGVKAECNDVAKTKWTVLGI